MRPDVFSVLDVFYICKPVKGLGGQDPNLITASMYFNPTLVLHGCLMVTAWALFSNIQENGFRMF